MWCGHAWAVSGFSNRLGSKKLALSDNGFHYTRGLSDSFSHHNHFRSPSVRPFLLWGLPYMTSKQKGEGGQEITQICGQTVLILRTEREKGKKIQKLCGRQIWKSSCPPLSLAARTHMSIYSHIPEGSARTIKRGKERPLAKNMIIPVFAATAHFSHMALSLREEQGDQSG